MSHLKTHLRLQKKLFGHVKLKSKATTACVTRVTKARTQERCTCSPTIAKLCESETLQPDLEKFQGDIHCPVTAMRGQFSTPIMVECCERFERIARKYTHIKKIIVLYFGDSDKAGNNIRRKVQVALKFYSGGGEITLDNGKKLKIPISPNIRIPVPVELVHVAITPEQVEKYGLTGFQLEAFMTNEKRLREFNKIERNAIKGCWNEQKWLDNCPPKKYDYESNGIEEPEDVDVDNELYEDTDMTKRVYICQKVTMETSNSNSPSDRTDKINGASASNGNSNEVTGEAQRLKDMYERLNKRSALAGAGNGHYMKMKDGEHKRLLFDPNKVTETDVSYPSAPDKPVHRVKFLVREIVNGKTSDVEEEWATSVRTSTQVLKWLLKGYNQIDIARFGTDKNNTRYEIDPVL